jgi:hypothetical protein
MNLKQRMMEYVNSDRRKSVSIPEWDMNIYFKPITVIEMDKIMTLAQGNMAATHIWALIEKAENEDGSKAFDAGDKPFLEQVDWSIITRMTGELLKTPSIDELKKN